MATLKRFENILEIVQTTGLLYGKTAYVFNLLGRRAGFTSTSVPNDIKEFDNGVATGPALSNSTLDIISSSASDTNSAGTGVQRVKVVYVNNSNNLVESAEINLNGTTLVTSVLTGVNEILWMESTLVGSGGAAAGNIRLRINGGTVECEQITTGFNKSRSARFMVPTGYTAYLHIWDVSAVNNDQDVGLLATVNSLDRSVSTVFKFLDSTYTASNTLITSNLGFLKLPALSRLKANTVSGGTAVTVKCDISILIVLVQN